MKPEMVALTHEIRTGRRPLSDAYKAKQIHEIPEAKVVDRAAFILERVKGKRVVEFGATGPMHDAIVKAAAHVIGVDRVSNAQHEPHVGAVRLDECPTGCVEGFDLDVVAFHTLPGLSDNAVDVIVAGEVIEHLSNPGHFLNRLRGARVPVIVTVPNAFSKAGFRSVASAGIENVNVDHVCWYSYRTLRTLLARHGFTIGEWGWYNGDARTAEGLAVVALP